MPCGDFGILYMHIIHVTSLPTEVPHGDFGIKELTLLVVFVQVCH